MLAIGDFAHRSMPYFAGGGGQNYFHVWCLKRKRLDGIPPPPQHADLRCHTTPTRWGITATIAQSSMGKQGQTRAIPPLRCDAISKGYCSRGGISRWAAKEDARPCESGRHDVAEFFHGFVSTNGLTSFC